MIVHKDIGDVVFKAFHEVHLRLGSGLLESVYEKAMEIELGLLSAEFVSQRGFFWRYF